MNIRESPGYIQPLNPFDRSDPEHQVVANAIADFEGAFAMPGAGFSGVMGNGVKHADVTRAVYYLCCKLAQAEAERGR